MRRFIFNTHVLGAVAGAWGPIQATRHGPRDWRLALLWVGWGLSVAVAVGTVVEEAKAERRELEAREGRRQRD